MHSCLIQALSDPDEVFQPSRSQSYQGDGAATCVVASPYIPAVMRQFLYL
jgi:hypothetical protein